MASWQRVALGLLILQIVLALANGDELAVGNDGATLLYMKGSFANGNRVLHDWRDSAHSFLHYCSWMGVTCDNITNRVITIHLNGLDLGGEISPAIGYLDHLTKIDLSSNNIYGQIPATISQLTLLHDLDLHDNKLTGPIPSSLWQMPNLVHMGLEHNNFDGSLSHDMCLFTRLIYLNLGDNNFIGGIPPEIGNCTTLYFLSLSNNHLTGEIPLSIGFLQVSMLRLNDNKLSGAMPSSIGLMYNLAFIDLSHNILSGSIPSVLGNLQNLTKLYLQENRLTGVIPPELGDMTMLTILDLTGNQLMGSIPPELRKLQHLSQLNLANNNLDGSLPETLSSCAGLVQINAHGNNLNGSIPSAFVKLRTMTYLNLSSNKLSGPVPVELTNIINLDTIDLSSNEINGSIPSSIGALHHLLRLNLSNNHINGLMPMEFGSLTSIMEIDLSSNNLSGPIPRQLGFLQNLVLLKVENNKLSGDLLPLSNCFFLSILNVSYNNFVGFVSATSNFSRFSPDSFMGNPKLCGYWNTSSRCHSTSLHRHRAYSIIGLISSGCVIIILLVLVGAFFALYRYKLHKKANNPQSKLIILNSNLAGYVYDDIIRMTNNLSEGCIIGRGASCVVYMCAIPGRKPIAIKKLSLRPRDLALFETELEIVSNINHRNLVSLHGYSLSSSGYWLVYEYMEKGSLYSLLHGSASKDKLDWNARVKIAIGAAQGLEYLHHDCKPKIIHRDVKTSNILIDSNGEAHIADFGFAKSLLISATHTSTAVIGTVGYIDPEFVQTARLTEKSDVFSFGIVLLELLTGKKALDQRCNLHQLIQERIANNITTVMDILDPTLIPTCNYVEVQEVFRLAIHCTELKSAYRPNMREVSRTFEHLVRTHTHSMVNFDPSASTSNDGFGNI